MLEVVLAGGSGLELPLPTVAGICAAGDLVVILDLTEDVVGIRLDRVIDQPARGERRRDGGAVRIGAWSPVGLQGTEVTAPIWCCRSGRIDEAVAIELET